MGPDSSLTKIHCMWISGYILLLGRRVLEKGQIPANLSMGRKEWMVVRGWGNCKFSTTENIIMVKAIRAMEWNVWEWGNLLAGVLLKAGQDTSLSAGAGHVNVNPGTAEKWGALLPPNPASPKLCLIPCWVLGLCIFVELSISKKVQNLLQGEKKWSPSAINRIYGSIL